jgi:hypothetical protein
LFRQAAESSPAWPLQNCATIQQTGPPFLAHVAKKLIDLLDQTTRKIIDLTQSSIVRGDLDGIETGLNVRLYGAALCDKALRPCQKRAAACERRWLKRAWIPLQRRAKIRGSSFADGALQTLEMPIRR